MRLLLISNTPFLPPTAGNRRRLLQMVEHLGGHGIEIGALLLPDLDVAEWDLDGMRERLSWLELVTLPPDATSLARRGVQRLLRAARGRRRAELRPIGVDAWCPPAFRARAAAVADAWRPDAVLVEYVFLSACLDRVPRPALRIIDTLDLMHRRQAVYDAAGLVPRWFHTSYAEERRGLERADVVLAIQEEEAAILRAMLPGRRVLVVPPSEPARPAPLERAERARLLYVASHNDLNVQGLRWFLDGVWPRLARDLPGLALEVCGNVRDKVDWALPPGVTLRGVVPSLDDAYARARVVIDPVLAATGVHLKIVDALCHGRPVVATPAAASGVPAGDREGVLVADGAEAFAAVVHRLVRDDDYWARTAGAAAEAARRFSPEAAFGPLVEALTDRARGTACRD